MTPWLYEDEITSVKFNLLEHRRDVKGDLLLQWSKRREALKWKIHLNLTFWYFPDTEDYCVGTFTMDDGSTTQLS